MKAYPIELRDRVVARVISGEAVRPVAALFSVSVATVVRWSQRFRATGTTTPTKRLELRVSKLDKDSEWILSRIAAEPDVTIEGLRGELAARGVVVSYGAVWKFLHRSGLSFKKKRSAE